MPPDAATQNPTNRRGPDGAILPGPVGRMLARVYGAEIARRNRRFDRGAGVVTFDQPVISVGNLSVGGTGKTPMVLRLVRLLREHGHDPAIAMRGYGAGRSGESDEARLYAESLDDLPIVAQPKRAEGLVELFAGPRGESVDCIVLDDGFQHRRIARQLDLVLIDASHDPFRSMLLPAGRLREPVESLARATHLALTHAELVEEPEADALAVRLAGAAGPDHCAVTAHEWTDLEIHAEGRSRREPAAWLVRRRVLAVCAIGRPDAFLEACRRSGAEVASSITLRDHDPYADAAIRRISEAAAAARADAIVTTAKDWTKLSRRGIDWPAPVCVPRLELAFRTGWEELSRDVLAIASSTPA